MVRFSLIAVGAAALTLQACEPAETDDGGQQGGHAVETEDSPLRFDFERADMFREMPNDVCRRKDRDFVLKLIARIDAALPVDAKGTAQFDRFFVEDAQKGDGQEAVIRFTARGKTGEIEPMFAIGPFNPENCQIGEMAGSVGKNVFTDAGKQGFKIP